MLTCATHRGAFAELARADDDEFALPPAEPDIAGACWLSLESCASLPALLELPLLPAIRDESFSASSSIEITSSEETRRRLRDCCFCDDWDCESC